MSKTIITLDTDWAPDYVIDKVAEMLVKAGAKATWFITHDSPAIQRLLKERLFECGIHPNLLPGSSQGKTIKEVFDFCLSVVPQAKTMRTHSLVQSTGIYDYAATHTPIKLDVSTLLFGTKYCLPGWHIAEKGRILKIPFCWEDDIEMRRGHSDWNASTIQVADGPRILNFHPVHVYLNAPDMAPYNKVKSLAPSLRDIKREDMNPFIQKNDGAGSMLESLLTSEDARRFETISSHFSGIHE